MFRVVHIPPKYEVEENKAYDPAKADVPGSALSGAWSCSCLLGVALAETTCVLIRATSIPATYFQGN